MAVYRVQRQYGYVSEIAKNSLGFGAIGALTGACLIGEKKPAMLLGLAGFTYGAVRGFLDARQESRIKQSLKIPTNEPATWSDLLKKYPKLKDAEIFIRKKKNLWEIESEADRLRFIVDWSELDSVFDQPGYFEQSTREVRGATGNNNLIAILNGGEVSFDVSTGKYYLVDTISGKFKETTIKEYSEDLVKCLNPDRIEFEDLSEESKKALTDLQLELKRILRV